VKAKLLYEFLKVDYEDADGDGYTDEWFSGEIVDVLAYVPAEECQTSNKWAGGAYMVQNSKGDIQAFDGQFIKLLPN